MATAVTLTGGDRRLLRCSTAQKDRKCFPCGSQDVVACFSLYRCREVNHPCTTALIETIANPATTSSNCAKLFATKKSLCWRMKRCCASTSLFLSRRDTKRQRLHS